MSDSAPSRSLDKIILRLPEGMRERLQARAAANGRSMNAEVVYLLDTAINNPGLLAELDLAREKIRIDSDIAELEDILERMKARSREIFDQVTNLINHRLDGANN